MKPLEMLKKAHSGIFKTAINGEVRNLREIYNLMGEAINQLEQRSRERTVISVCDEDLQEFIDPETVSDERFDEIVSEMQDYMDSSFQSAIMEAIQNTEETV